eukprot:TRINITY_DN13024_c0_g1_i2.p1 TRINITY_DN13024_c0_g1~~TRINITY_DN13024_c0_g1_i2.p1  ORF type:complete len:396 (-),score=117.53 TRINITY_DN13024_c0_g1_i2:102-1289(-)
MLGKLKKGLDKAAKKTNQLVDKASKAVDHKVNSVRDHKELRDILTEAKDYSQSVQTLARHFNKAMIEMSAFQVKYCGVPETALGQVPQIHENYQANVLNSTANIGKFVDAIQEVLKAENAATAATKAASNQNAPNRQELDQNQFQTSQAAAQAKRFHLRGGINALIAHQQEFFQTSAGALNAQVAIFQQLSGQDPNPLVTWEQLWDEPRPAVGNAAVKPPPPPGDRKPEPWEELNALPRPLDGDTRAKYAKKWNELLKDLLEQFREVMKDIDRLWKIRVKLEGFFTAWVQSREDHKPWETAALYMHNFEEQFTTKYLIELKSAAEPFFQYMEPHLAIVPKPNEAPVAPNAQLPRMRADNAKNATLAFLNAWIGFYARAEQELMQFSQAINAQLPQ